MKKKRVDFHKPLREKHDKEHFRESVKDEVLDELDSIGYSDEEIEALDKYINEFVLAYENSKDRHIPHKSPYQIIHKQHERGEIEEWIVLNTNLRS